MRARLAVMLFAVFVAALVASLQEAPAAFAQERCFLEHVHETCLPESQYNHERHLCPEALFTLESPDRLDYRCKAILGLLRRGGGVSGGKKARDLLP